MRNLRFLAVVLGALLVPAAASAQLALGARLGFAKAGGEATKGSKMSDGLSGAIPVQVDVGYKILPELQVGAYFSYGFGRVGGDVKDECDEFDLDCSASVLRLGVQALWAFEQVNPKFVPWVGVGFGWEKGKLEQSLEGDYIKQSLSGWELVNLQAGGDFKVTPALRVGPFVSFSINRYGSYDFDASLGGTDGSESGDVPSSEKTNHNFFTVGVRGEFGM